MEKKCDGRWNGHYIPASKEAYDLLIAEGYIPCEDEDFGWENYRLDHTHYCIEDGNVIYPFSKEFRYTKPMYIVNGKLSATPKEDFTITETTVFPEKQKTSGNFATKVYNLTYSIAEMLIDKNRKYGNSALEPKRIFSKMDSLEQLKVRIDDKLSRVANQNTDEDEDVVNDLLGYLVLYKIAKAEEK